MENAEDACFASWFGVFRDQNAVEEAWTLERRKTELDLLRTVGFVDCCQRTLPALDQRRVQIGEVGEHLAHGPSENAAWLKAQRTFEGGVGEQVAILSVVATDDHRQILDQRPVRVLPFEEVGRPLADQFLGHRAPVQHVVQVDQQEQGEQRAEQRNVRHHRRIIALQPARRSLYLYRPQPPSNLDLGSVAVDRRRLCALRRRLPGRGPGTNQLLFLRPRLVDQEDVQAGFGIPGVGGVEHLIHAQDTEDDAPDRRTALIAGGRDFAATVDGCADDHGVGLSVVDEERAKIAAHLQAGINRLLDERPAVRRGVQIDPDGQVIGLVGHGIEDREIAWAIAYRLRCSFSVAFADRKGVAPNPAGAALEVVAISRLDDGQPAKTANAAIADHWSGERLESTPIDRFNAAEKALQGRQVVQLIDNPLPDEVGTRCRCLAKALFKAFLGGVRQ
nr:hypothetical protein [Candidatus Accumulibacter sp. ACC005]